MEINNASLGQMTDIVNLDDCEHKVDKPKRKHFKKQNAPDKQNGGHKGGQEGAKQEQRN